MSHLTYNVSSVIEHISTKNSSNCSWTSPLAYEDLLAYNLCYWSRTSHQSCFRHSRFLTAIRCSTTAAVSRNDKFYCHCLPNIAQTLKSLNEALKGSTKHFKWSARFYVDASDSHDGAVLQYIQNRGWVPLSFFSKQVDSTQS